MLKIVLSNRFRKDLKLAQKRGINLNLLRDVVNALANELELFLFRTGTHSDLF